MKIKQIIQLLLICAILTLQCLSAIKAGGSASRYLSDPEAIALAIGNAKGDAQVLEVANDISYQAKSISTSLSFLVITILITSFIIGLLVIKMFVEGMPSENVKGSSITVSGHPPV